MKLYILTCINEDATLVYCQPYSCRVDAENAMEEMYEAERKEFEANERLDEDYDQFTSKYAVVGNCDYHYDFQITECDL